MKKYRVKLHPREAIFLIAMKACVSNLLSVRLSALSLFPFFAQRFAKKYLVYFLQSLKIHFIFDPLLLMYFFFFIVSYIKSYDFSFFIKEYIYAYSDYLLSICSNELFQRLSLL